MKLSALFEAGARKTAKCGPRFSKVRNKGASLLRGVALIAVVYGLCALNVHAQMGAGSIQGTITDPSGAVVPGATVEALNTSTNQATTTKTTKAGFYNASPLQAGKYTVIVQAKGFQKLTQENVTVNALETVGLNLKLAVGAATQSVTVTAAPPMLNTSNATIGSTMENHVYSQLPIVMNADQRNATAFAYLMPGVQSNETRGNATDNSGIFNGAGPQGFTAGIYIDGVAITQPAGQGDPRFVWTAIPFDAVNQFQVQTSGYSAALEGQGIENYVVKSGTNQFHGSVFEYFRNTALDTWNYFSKAQINPVTGKPQKPEEHQNEYGMLLGGPIWKNKVFFFGSYDGFRYARGASPSYVTIPTMAERQGNFTAAGLPTIYDPTSTVCTGGSCTRTPFVSDLNGVPTANVIPQNMISPVAQFFQKELPTPTNNSLTNNYLGGNSTGLSNWSTTERVDADLTPKQRISVIFAAGRQSTVGITSTSLPLPYARAKYYIPQTKVFIFQHTYVITPTVVNQFKYAYGRYFDIDGNPQYGNKNWSSASAGIGNLPTGQAADSFPEIKYHGHDSPTQWGVDSQYESTFNTYTMVDNLQWTHGRQSWEFGFQKQWLQSNYLQAAGASRPLTINYSNSQTGQYETGSTTVDPTTGYSYASYLLGAVDSAGFDQYSHNVTGLRFRPFSAYAQDDFHATNHLTLNLGLRYDLYPGMREANHAMSFFNPTITNPVTGNLGILQFAGSGQDSCQCATPIHTYWQNFGPRLGLAYSFLHDTVLHAAWGIMYTHGGGTGGTVLGPPTLGFTASPNAVSTVSGEPAFYLNNSSYFTTNGIANTNFPAYEKPPFFYPGFGTGYSTNVSTPASSMTYLDPYLSGRSPEYENWNFGVQRKLTRNMTIAVTYVGSEGHFEPVQNHDARGYWSNEMNPKYLALGSLLSDPATAANIAQADAIMPGVSLPYPTFSGTIEQMLRPFPQYPGVSDVFGNVGNSSFNALELVLKQRPTHGLTFTVNYTWSKSVDDDGTFRSGYLSNRVERSLSVADMPQNLNVNFVYDLPFGRAGSMTGSNPYVRAVTKNWALSGIVSYQAGTPLAITATNCVTPGQGTCMPDLNPSYSGSVRINGGWGSGVTSSNVHIPFINKDAFSIPAPYTIGNAPRTAPYHLFGPAYKDVDISLRRRFHIYGRTHLQVQADAFNLFNNVVFGGINTTVGDSNFGEVSKQANSSRDIQLAARVEF